MSWENVTYALQVAATIGEGYTPFFPEAKNVVFRIEDYPFDGGGCGPSFVQWLTGRNLCPVDNTGGREPRRRG
jgi:hypothetical protein